MDGEEEEEEEEDDDDESGSVVGSVDTKEEREQRDREMVKVFHSFTHPPGCSFF